MSTHKIIENLGGRDFVASKTGVATNTVAHWVRRGKIPSRLWPDIIKLARSKKLKGVTMSSLQEMSAKRAPTPQEARS